MELLDLSFYLDPPKLTVKGILEVQALAPLSMVSAQPGTYFRTSLKPPIPMVYGAIENALGWHFSLKLRKLILTKLAKKAKKIYGKNPEFENHPWLKGKEVESSLTRYFSLLQFHLRLGEANDPINPITYDDLWSMHLRDRGMSFVGGSRNYDHRLESIITRLRQSTAEFKKMDKKEAKIRQDEKYELGESAKFTRISIKDIDHTEIRKINPGSLGGRYPRHYVSPKKRGFVIPQEIYQLPFTSTARVYNLLQNAISSAVAPIYLGTSEGWIDLKITNDD